jgi:hypothetical protein
MLIMKEEAMMHEPIWFLRSNYGPRIDGSFTVRLLKSTTPNWSPTYEKWYSTTLQKLVYMQADFEMVKTVQYTLLSTHKVQAVMGNH